MSKTILSKDDILTERKMSIDVENIVEKNLIIFNELTRGLIGHLVTNFYPQCTANKPKSLLGCTLSDIKYHNYEKKPFIYLHSVVIIFIVSKWSKHFCIIFFKSGPFLASFYLFLSFQYS